MFIFNIKRLFFKFEAYSLTDSQLNHYELNFVSINFPKWCQSVTSHLKKNLVRALAFL